MDASQARRDYRQERQMGTKVCRDCDTEKPLTDYYRTTNGNGEKIHRSECKMCHIANKKVSKDDRRNRWINNMMLSWR